MTDTATIEVGPLDKASKPPASNNSCGVKNSGKNRALHHLNGSHGAIRNRVKILSDEGVELPLEVSDREIVEEYFFIKVDDISWPDDLNPGWKALHAPEAYTRWAAEHEIEVSADALLVVSTKEFGEVLLVPADAAIPALG